MNRMIGISLATTLLALPAQATDSWRCTEIIGNKSFVMKYKVDGDTLIHNDGKGHSTIIDNNSDHVISYIAIVHDTTRYPNNSAPVVIAEPHVSYIIIEKSSGRFTALDSLVLDEIANRYGAFPAPNVVTGHCKLD